MPASKAARKCKRSARTNEAVEDVCEGLNLFPNAKNRTSSKSAEPKTKQSVPKSLELGKKIIKTLLEDGRPWRDPYSSVKQLLLKGADPNIIDDVGRTPLNVAIERKHDLSCSLLLDSGAAVNHMTPLIYGARDGRVEICELILDRGGDINAKDVKGCTALIEATWRGDVEICELLLRRGADANCTSEVGESALVIAAQYAYDDICRLLIDKVRDINANNPCALLLNKGADVMLRDAFGQPCLHVAAQMGNLQICILLLFHDADAFAVDKYGISALDVAKENKHIEVIALLEKTIASKAVNKPPASNKRKRNDAPIVDNESVIVNLKETLARVEKETAAVKGTLERVRGEHKAALERCEQLETTISQLEIEKIATKVALKLNVQHLEHKKADVEAKLQVESSERIQEKHEFKVIIERLNEEKMLLAARLLVESSDRKLEKQEFEATIERLEQAKSIAEEKLEVACSVSDRVMQLEMEKDAAQIHVTRVLRSNVVAKQEPSY